MTDTGLREDDRIKGAYGFDDPAQLGEYYDAWASRYDRDVTEERYCGPAVLTDLAVLLHSGYQGDDRRGAEILDVGCGTGLIGVALAARGFGSVDGVDLSPEMVHEAALTGTYRELWGGVDLNRTPIDVPDDRYDMVLCCGAFLPGHLDPALLAEFARVTRPGGFVLATTRESYFATTQFDLERRRVIDAGLVRQVACLDHALYIGGENAHYWAFRALRTGPPARAAA